MIIQCTLCFSFVLAQRTHSPRALWNVSGSLRLSAVRKNMHHCRHTDVELQPLRITSHWGDACWMTSWRTVSVCDFFLFCFFGQSKFLFIIFLLFFYYFILNFILIFHRFLFLFIFHIALFSALKQTPCAHVAFETEWVTVFIYSAFFNINRGSVLITLFGCYVAGATWNCCCLGACCVYTTHPCSNLQCYFIRCHVHASGAYVFSCNLSPALLAEWQGSFTCSCCCGNTGVERTPK